VKPGLLLCLLLLSVHPGVCGSSAPEITFGVFVEADSESLTDRTLPIRLDDPEEVIQVERFALITAENIDGASQTSNGGVLFEFNQAGRLSLETVTSTRQGKTLVVFLNNRVIYSAIIDIPLRSGRLLVPSGISPAEFEALQAFIASEQQL